MPDCASLVIEYWVTGSVRPGHPEDWEFCRCGMEFTVALGELIFHSCRSSGSQLALMFKLETSREVLPMMASNPMTDLDIYTVEELQHALVHVVAHARGEELNDGEVQKFWQLHEEILRRRAASENAA